MTEVSMLGIAAGAVAVTALAASATVYANVRRRNCHLWLQDYCRSLQDPPDRPPADAPRHMFISICDHFEPEWNHADSSTALSRVDRWRQEYPERFSQFHDSRGRVPQQTFFFPQDQYAPEYLDKLAELQEAGFGDVEVHLHHDNDSEQGLRDKLESFRETLHEQHGLLRKHPETGEITYGFIHGDWALNNSRPDGRCCGVDNEIDILLQTGCYADFTMPSAPSDTQTSTINSIYYACDQPGERKSHDIGQKAAVGMDAPGDSLLMVQGPLLLDWLDRNWGVLPRIENGDIHVGRPPSKRRLELWEQAGIQVQGRPDWIFVKLHTHGCKDGNLDMLLSLPMQEFHRNLEEKSQQDPFFNYYYVSAWEMSQLVHQAENGAEAPEFNTEQRAVLEAVAAGC